MGHVVASVPGLGQAASLSSSINSVLSDPDAAHHDSIAAFGQSAVLVPDIDPGQPNHDGNNSNNNKKILVTGGETYKKQVLPLTVLRTFRPHDAVALWETKSLKKKDIKDAQQQSSNNNSNGKSNRKKPRYNASPDAAVVAYPVPRTLHTLTPDATGNHLYLIGGVKADGKEQGKPCKSMFALDVKHMTWKSVDPQQPTASRSDLEKLVGRRFAHSAHYYGGSPASKSQRTRMRKTKAGCILVYGGYDTTTSTNARDNNTDGGEILLPKNTIHSFDIRSQKWSLVSSDEQGPRRAYHASVILNDRYLVVHGGCTAGDDQLEEMSNETHIFDLFRACWLTSSTHPHSDTAPTPRRRHAAANGIGPQEGSAVFYGGAVAGGEYSDSLYMLTLVEDNNNNSNILTLWKHMALSPQPFRSLALEAAALVACETQRKYFVIGGVGKNGTQNSVPFTIDADHTEKNLLPKPIQLRLRVRKSRNSPQKPNGSIHNNSNGRICGPTGLQNNNNNGDPLTEKPRINGAVKNRENICGDINNNRIIPPAAANGVVRKASDGAGGKKRKTPDEEEMRENRNSTNAKRAKTDLSNNNYYYEGQAVDQKGPANGTAQDKDDARKSSKIDALAAVQANEARIGATQQEGTTTTTTTPIPVKLKLRLRKKNTDATGNTAHPHSSSAPMSSVGDVQFSAPLANYPSSNGENSTLLKKNPVYQSYVKKKKPSLPISKGRRDKILTGTFNAVHAKKKNLDVVVVVHDNDVHMNDNNDGGLQPNGKKIININADKEDVNMGDVGAKNKEDVKMNIESTNNNTTSTFRETMDISDDEKLKDDVKITSPRTRKAIITSTKKKNNNNNKVKNNTICKPNGQKRNLALNRPRRKPKINNNNTTQHRPETEVSAHGPASSDASTDEEEEGSEPISGRNGEKDIIIMNLNLRKQVESLTKELRTQEGAIEDYKEEIGDLEKENEKLKKRNDGLKQDLGEAKEHLKTEILQKKQVGELAEKLEKQVKEKCDTTERLVGLLKIREQDIKTANARINELESQLKEALKLHNNPVSVSRNASAEDENHNVINNTPAAAAAQRLQNNTNTTKIANGNNNIKISPNDGDVEMKEEADKSVVPQRTSIATNKAS